MKDAPMERKSMSGTQRFFTRFAGAETAAAMESHSRAWLVRVILSATLGALILIALSVDLALKLVGVV